MDLPWLTNTASSSEGVSATSSGALLFLTLQPGGNSAETAKFLLLQLVVLLTLEVLAEGGVQPPTITVNAKTAKRGRSLIDFI